MVTEDTNPPPPSAFFIPAVNGLTLLNAQLMSAPSPNDPQLTNCWLAFDCPFGRGPMNIGALVPNSCLSNPAQMQIVLARFRQAAIDYLAAPPGSL